MWEETASSPVLISAASLVIPPPRLIFFCVVLDCLRDLLTVSSFVGIRLAMRLDAVERALQAALLKVRYIGSNNKY